jgi:hypothetical protein
VTMSVAAHIPCAKSQDNARNSSPQCQVPQLPQSVSALRRCSDPDGAVSAAARVSVQRVIPRSRPVRRSTVVIGRSRVECSSLPRRRGPCQQPPVVDWSCNMAASVRKPVVVLASAAAAAVALRRRRRTRARTRPLSVCPQVMLLVSSSVRDRLSAGQAPRQQQGHGSSLPRAETQRSRCQAQRQCAVSTSVRGHSMVQPTAGPQ